jgi:ABC-type amino acid transport substrate-binding protein
VEVERQDPFAGLEAGDLDVVVAAAPVTSELETRVNLSDRYYRLQQAVVVNADVRPDLSGVADLAEGDEVAVVEGSTGQAWAMARLEPAAVETRTYPDAEEAAVALAAGAVDAAIVDELSGIWESASRGSLRVVQTFATGDGLGIAEDPDNLPLLEAVNRALADMVADGAYDRLYDRYGEVLPAGGRITAP